MFIHDTNTTNTLVHQLQLLKRENAKEKVESVKIEQSLKTNFSRHFRGSNRKNFEITKVKYTSEDHAQKNSDQYDFVFEL